MAKAIPLDEALARLNALRADLKSPAAREQLLSALADKNNHIAARAATLIAEGQLADLQPQLQAAFDRFMANAAKVDRGCTAKSAIAKALYEMGCPAESVFLRGIHHVQLEPSFGGQTDTAPELRGTCALGLVRMGYRDVMTELADLLMDPQMQARIFAARAIAYSGRDDGAPLLRMKILAGDREVDVTAECFTALLRLSGRRGLALVARHIDDPDASLANAAALAIGESRLPEAFDLLRQRWDSDLRPASRMSLLLPMAMLRLPQSLDFLLECVASAHPQTAAAAIEALAIYKHDDSARTRILAAARSRDEPAVQQALRKLAP